MPRCWIFRIQRSLCTVTRFSLCKYGENVSTQCIFLRTRRKQILSTKLRPPDQVITDRQRSHEHWSTIERFDIIASPTLLCVSGLECFILCEDCHAHRSPFKSKGDRCVPRVELQLKRQRVCTRTVRSKSCPFDPLLRRSNSVLSQRTATFLIRISFSRFILKHR